MLARSAVISSRRAMLAPGHARLMSRWGHVQEGPRDPILGVTEAFKADTDKRKLNLGVGAYRDDNLKPVVLPSVLEASQRIVEARLDNEYGPIEGDAGFLDVSLKLAYGDDSQVLKDKRVVGLQSLSGTGALRLLGAFIAKFSTVKPTVYVPDPTWATHYAIFQHAGLEVKPYKYYSSKSRGVDFEGMTKDISSVPEGSVILFHASAHNPTGADPTKDQWKELSTIVKKKNHLALFDMAYQGFASGNPDLDAFSVRHFLAEGHDVALAQSFAKNFGLYGQRVGVASFVTQNAKETEAVKSQAKIIARAIYSNPPIHGARIVKTILSDPKLNAQWKSEVNEMATRIISMRTLLRAKLEKLGSPHPWNHITDQIGMFCYSGLSAAQVDRLKNEYHIYMTSNGRISMAGLSSKTVDYLAEAIHAVSK